MTSHCCNMVITANIDNEHHKKPQKTQKKTEVKSKGETQVKVHQIPVALGHFCLVKVNPVDEPLQFKVSG